MTVKELEKVLAYFPDDCRVIFNLACVDYDIAPYVQAELPAGRIVLTMDQPMYHKEPSGDESVGVNRITVPHGATLSERMKVLEKFQMSDRSGQ